MQRAGRLRTAGSQRRAGEAECIRLPVHAADARRRRGRRRRSAERRRDGRGGAVGVRWRSRSRRSASRSSRRPDRSRRRRPALLVAHAGGGDRGARRPPIPTSSPRRSRSRSADADRRHRRGGARRDRRAPADAVTAGERRAWLEAAAAAASVTALIRETHDADAGRLGGRRSWPSSRPARPPTCQAFLARARRLGVELSAGGGRDLRAARPRDRRVGAVTRPPTLRTFGGGAGGWRHGRRPTCCGRSLADRRGRREALVARAARRRPARRRVGAAARPGTAARGAAARPSCSPSSASTPARRRPGRRRPTGC